MSSDELRIPPIPDLEGFLEDHQLDPALRGPLADFVERGSRGLASAKRGGIAMASEDTSDARLVWTRHLALGGMGEIHRVYDSSLHRTLVMKVLRERFRQDPAMCAVFLKEAQFTAQLAHPSIPPVHEIGRLDDGRPFFTMKEVHGRTLSDILKHLHQREPEPSSATSQPAPSAPAPAPTSEMTLPTLDQRTPRAPKPIPTREVPDTPIGEWTEHRLLAVFQKICEAVAYAHSRAVIHCDLKPDNVMVGRFGEVVVMDWGVALLAAAEAAGDSSNEPAVETRGFDASIAEMIGGTPGYMAPEQMAAAIDSVGPFTDVYALGVILYEIFAGRRPYRGKRSRLFNLAMQGVVPPLPPRDETIADEALFDLIVRAMRPVPENRIPGGSAIAEEISRWREGALKREKALRFVHQAQALLPQIAQRRARGVELRAEIELAERSFTGATAIEDKIPVWKTEDRAEELEREAALHTVQATRLLRDALVHAPGLPDATRLLAQIHFDEHRLAESRRDWRQAERHELLLRAHDSGEYHDYLAGVEWLDVRFARPCRARLYALRERRRQLVPEMVRAFATTDQVQIELPVGSYVLMLRPDDGPIVNYPFILERRAGWRPDAITENAAVELPLADELGEGEVLVPSSPVRVDGEWTWVPAFVARERQVSALELAEFLASDAGAAWRSGFLKDGLPVWRASWPAVGVSFDAAEAYAVWLSEQTNQRWRLPTELEWAKAAGGVDGRIFPWGDRFDESFCLCRGAEHAPQCPMEADSHPADVSPYGLLAVGGNVRDWCAGEATPDGRRPVRGGSYRLPLAAAPIALRAAVDGSRGHADVGFRLVRDYSSSASIS